MLERVKQESREQAFSRMLLIIESGSKSEQAFARKAGRYRLIEHFLMLDT